MVKNNIKLLEILVGLAKGNRGYIKIIAKTKRIKPMIIKAPNKVYGSSSNPAFSKYLLILLLNLSGINAFPNEYNISSILKLSP